MEALLFTLGVVVVMVLVLALLARSWPRTSGLGGYRAGRGAGHDAGASSTDAGAEAGGVQEDDDARWQWHDRDEGAP
jgi:hypothetical protein